MLQYVATILLLFQRFPITGGNSTRHRRDMKGQIFLMLPLANQANHWANLGAAGGVVGGRITLAYILLSTASGAAGGSNNENPIAMRAAAPLRLQGVRSQQPSTASLIMFGPTDAGGCAPVCGVRDDTESKCSFVSAGLSAEDAGIGSRNRLGAYLR
jgi:hypothetical protein